MIRREASDACDEVDRVASLTLLTIHTGDVPMNTRDRSARARQLRPNVDALEGRALLNAAMPHPAPHTHAQVITAQSHGPAISLINKVAAGGYRFVNFDGIMPGTNPGAGTNMNGIAGSGQAVGFTIDNNGQFLNFTADPLRSNRATLLNINGSTTANAFGINAHGSVVGNDGNGHAFVLNHGKLATFIPGGGTAAVAFGINDHGTIVGQYTTANAMPGFIRLNAKATITINAPAGPNTVNAQGINNNGLVVGFSVGTDGQVHGFKANANTAKHGAITGTPIADPQIPAVPGEPGATFVFSQVLAVNDRGIAVGYYGDSTTSQHGFLYNTHTGKYTFLDDPSEAFSNGVEVTQITGITNSGEITGFYSDAAGVFHGFVARPHLG
jgi:probable HAF family extracellular repeat protein